MAKGNMFLGMARGSVGDVTFYRKSGQQAARVRNRNPRNPKTEAQVIQRMILATASKAYSRLKSITDHSFEGIEYGSASQSHFLKRAMDDLRAFVAANYPTATETNLLNYRGLAEPNFGASAGSGLLISEGTIPSIPAALTTGADPEFDHFGAIPHDNAIQSVMTAIGAQKGDQITAVAMLSSGLVVKSRYVINADATTEELNVDWPSDADEDAFDQTSSLIGDVRISVDSTTPKIVLISQSGASIIAGAIILSRKSGDSWLRSTQRFIPIGDNIETLLVENGPNVVVPMWLAGTAQIESENPYFLNQAEE